MERTSGVRPTIPHQPGLDGLRGLAVVAVLVFHAGPATWLPGGFLGVSVFFTLSGYLIGSLVITEVEATGALDLGRFWARRVRRLLPALLLTAVAVVVLARTIEVGSATRSDLLGGLTYSTNWVQLAAGRSYADLFRVPSPVTHLWSLAIEEQFYVLFPLLVWAVARTRPAAIRRAVLVGGVVVFATGAAFAWLVDDADVAYLATPARAPEIAVGLVLAAATRARPLATEGPAAGPLRRRATAFGGVVALAVAAYAAHQTAVTDRWIARGGLAGFALVSTALVVAAVRPGPVRRLLGWAPLRWLGLVSYGLYLLHWPVVVVLSHPRVELDPVPLFAARAVISVVLAGASYRLVEQPIRRGRVAALARPVAALRAGGAARVVAVVGVAVATPTSGDRRPAPRAAPAVVPATGATVTSAVTEGPHPPVVVLLGDSVPNWLVRDGGHALDPGDVTVVDGTMEGCDGADGAPVGRAGTGVVVSVPASCTGWLTQYPPIFEGRPVDVAALVIGSGAVLDRRLDDGDFHGPCDPVAARWYGDDVTARLRWLRDRADRVVLVLPAWAEDWSGWVNPPDHRARTDCVRRTLTAAASATGVDTLDLADDLCPDGPDRCRPLRQRDGVHLDPSAAPGVLRWLIDRLLT